MLLRTKIKISMTDYFYRLCCPLLIFSVVAIPLPYIVSYIMPVGFLRLLLVTMFTGIVSVGAFYWVGLNHKEKKMVKGVISRVK